MTPQQIVGTAARLFAIWLVITAFQAVAIGGALKAVSGNPRDVWVPYLVGGFYLLAGLLCWFFPMVIAHKLVPRTKFDNVLRLPAQQALVVACVVLGLLIIAFKALAPVMGYLSVCALWIGSGQPVSTMDAGRHIDGVIGFAQLALGLFLVVKAQVVARHLLSDPQGHISSRHGTS
jgi:hypothetical protein